MPALWTDLLTLHGYISDVKLLLRLAKREQPPASCQQSAENSLLSLAKKVARSTRLCLGIGDGVPRSQ